MEDSIWEMRKSFEGLGNNDEKQAILADKCVGKERGGAPAGEPMTAPNDPNISTPLKEGSEKELSHQRSNSKVHVVDLADPVEDLKADLDLSLGDQLDCIDTKCDPRLSGFEPDSLVDPQADHPKYSPKLSIEDHLDRIALPLQAKRTSIISQRSAISANLVTFNNANSNTNVNPSRKQSSTGGSLSSLISERSGTVISCHNVGYQVPDGTKNRCGCGIKQHKFILKDVSGLFKPGVNAILGPTGSGKTSLLDVLAGRKDPHGLCGHVLVNGARQPDNFKCMTGYVIQDDIVMGMLTVRENIAFSAALRLPSDMSAAKRSQKVNELITDLGLSKCADTKIGTEFRRGVSGGERKRTNIGMELITSPSVLFLDEPTTGLDSNTAYSVMHLLQRLSRRGKTVIFSIHQPRYSIFKLFDNMLLLANGETIYHGAAQDSLKYFNNIGYMCEEHNNPPDFFLDIIGGGVIPSITAAANHTEENITRNGISGETEVLIDAEEDMSSQDEVCTARQKVLVQQYRKSSLNNKLVEELKPIYLDFEKSEVNNTLVRQKIDYNTPWCTQLLVVGRRSFCNMYRNPHTLATQVFSAILLGLIVGTIYFQVDSSHDSGIQNRVGAFFFIVMNYVFGNMSAVDIFIKERALFIHENVSGFYRMSVYFLAKLLFDVVPMRGIPILVFTALTYFMIGLQPSAAHFFFFLLATLLTSLAGTSVALLFSASANNHAIGTIFTSITWVFMMIFSGLLVNVETVAKWLQWFKYLSIFRYSMNAFTINELKDQMFCDYNDHGNVTILCISGNEYMTNQGIAHSTAWDLWHNMVALLLIALGFLILTYVQLRRIEKHR